MSNWYERAESGIEKELEQGLISDAEYNEQMRDLNAEYEESRQDAAQEAYDNY